MCLSIKSLKKFKRKIVGDNRYRHLRTPLLKKLENEEKLIKSLVDINGEAIKTKRNSMKT